MPWGVVAAGVTAAGSVGSGLLGASASSAAAKAQQQAAKEALGFQRQVYDKTTNDLAPFLQGGTTAFGDLQRLLGIGSPGGPSSPVLQMLGIGGPGPGGSINPATFVGSPGYQYAVQQGNNAVTNSAAAHGGLGGNALRVLQATGQGLANQNWGQYLGNVGNAWQQQISNVAGVGSAGQNAAVQQGGFGQNFANAAGSNIWGGANAAANGIMGAANATGGALNGVGQNLSTLFNSPKFQQQLDGMFGGGGGSYGSIDPNNQSVAPNTWSQQPDSYYLQGGAGYTG